MQTLDGQKTQIGVVFTAVFTILTAYHVPIPAEVQQAMLALATVFLAGGILHKAVKKARAK